MSTTQNRRVSSMAIRPTARTSLQPAAMTPRPGTMRTASNNLLSRRDSLTPSLTTDTQASTPDLPIADVGDRVEVPGGYHGIVQYVGPVADREGTFLGIDLDAEHANKGRNDGTHKGQRYFNTKTPTSGLFAPQGKCQILETIRKRESQVSAGGTKHPLSGMQPPAMTGLGLGPPPRTASGSHQRVSSRTYNVRPESRLSLSAAGPHTRSDSEVHQQQAQQHQQLLNDNARLREQLAALEAQHARLATAKAVQAQEMDEMMMTVKELEAYMASGSHTDDAQETIRALQEALAERDDKILQLREEATERRRDFQAVTEHQEQTIEQLKMLHERRIAEMEEQRSDLEERLLSSAGTDSLNPVEVARQVSALEQVCDEMQRGSEQAKEAMDIAHGRIAELEQENVRLHDEVIASRTAALAQGSSDPPKQVSKRSSLDKLPQGHPQRASAFGMLEGEVRRLEEEAARIERTSAQKAQQANAKILALERELADIKNSDMERQLLQEREQRMILEDRYAELERQLEDTIMQIEQASLPARAASRSTSLTTSPSLSIRIPAPTRTPDPLRSPRPPRGRLTDNEDDCVEPASAGHSVCEFCGKTGHDMLQCKDVFGTPQQKQQVGQATSSMTGRQGSSVGRVKEDAETMTPPRVDKEGRLWCACCGRYGLHGTEECPDADEQF